MAPLKRVCRGEVHRVSLDPTRGSEIRKTRPCLIVSLRTVDQQRLLDRLGTIAPETLTTVLSVLRELFEE